MTLAKARSTFTGPRRPRADQSKGGLNLFYYLRLPIMAVLGCVLLYAFSDTPYVAVLALDILFCSYLISVFDAKYKYLFLLHPVILFISSQLFSTPFLEAGDGGAYQAVVGQYLNTQDLTFDASSLLSAFSVLDFIRYASLGVAPTFAIPEFIFNNPADQIYYMWQGVFHVILCAVVVTLAYTWRILDRRYLLSMALFAVIGPSFFDLGAAPTRHVVTFFGIFLLCITHLAMVEKLTAMRTIWFAVALLMVLISKTPLLLPYLIFVAIDLVLIQRFRMNVAAALMVGMIAVGVLLLGAYFYQTTLDYDETAKGGAATFSGLTQLPVIGWIVKYVYALLAPFPWSDAPSIVAGIYAGNGLLFFMHVLSSLTGIYLISIVIVRWRAIWAYDNELKRVVTYGVIMSLSILKGAVGFHTYLLIYFPMFAPLLTISHFRINPWLPVGFVIFLELIVLVGK